MRKFLFTILACMLSFIGVQAQSKIVFMSRAVAVEIDGSFTLNGGEKMQVVGDMRTGLWRNPTVRNITVNEEGKVFIKVDLSLVNKYVSKDMACEYQLSVEDGQTYYLYLTYSGLNNFKIVEYPEKKVEKFLKDKHLQTLPDITVEAE